MQTGLKSLGLDKLLESDAVKVILESVSEGGDFLLKDHQGWTEINGEKSSKSQLE